MEHDHGHVARMGCRPQDQLQLGIYVSQAQRESTALWLEFDVASEDLAFTLKTLKRVLPEAEIEGVSPRVFPHRALAERDAH